MHMEFGNNSGNSPIQTVITPAKAKPVADSAETAVDLSKEDIYNILVKAVTAPVSAMVNEINRYLNSKLDGVLKDLKTKDEEINNYNKKRTNCGCMSII